MQKTVPVLLAAAALAMAVTACGGGKSSSSSSTTTTTASSPASSPAASPMASSSSTTTTTTTTTKKGSMAAAGGAAVGNGASVFTSNCSSCHQANGKGQPGVFPPLAGNSFVTGPADAVIAVVKNGKSGKITVNGQTYNGQMPAWKGTLSNADIAHVITYIRSSWGNHAAGVTEAQVAAAK